MLFRSVGLDGTQKMSKSLGNYVGVAEPPAEQFGKLMSIPDSALEMYLTHATGWDPDRIDAAIGALRSGDLHPNRAKRDLGRAVADRYHGPGAGEVAEAEFDRVHKAHEVPSDMPEFDLEPGTDLASALVAAGLVASRREAVRQMGQGGVRLDGEPVTDGAGIVPSGVHVLQVGRRRWARLTVSG